MKNKLYLLLLLAGLFACSKDSFCDESFCVRINGKRWWPSSGFKTNSLSFTLTDNGSIFWFSAQNGSTSLLVSVRDTIRGIQVREYQLGEHFNAGYYTEDSNEDFRTDQSHTGSLSIASIDSYKTTVSGTFRFKARNAMTGEVAEISNGSFNATYYEY
ncbi:DUF6252 family protein [Pontibacter ramchanderi]|uniref:Uncharacterized protein n=1 Tax=Pontibacter ramchanderi TaxID=1179743 RepID=A0A2N3U701_9BACT|nr:DUF6252 family protein [Pontibacter ramchanderi]PKV62514.1 hypothetical protein BD749_3717 [Pontibacter ramchanderi]